MSTDLQNQTQDYNPLTGDIQLNPAAWGLSLQDINSAATISLKSSIYAGNVNLTADQYREIQSLVKTKYSGVDYTGMIKGGGMATDISMTGRDPGLYMNQERIGFWKDDVDQWQAYIANNGNFAFQGDANNYISWNGSELVIRGSIFLEDGTSITDMNNTFYQASAPTVFTDGDIWFDTDDGNKMYLSVASTWTSVQDALAQTAQTTADGKAKVYYQTTAPTLTAGDVGDLWVDTDSGNRVATWNGTTWVSVSNADAIQALAAAATAQSTADGKIESFYSPTQPVGGSEGDIWFDTANGNRISTKISGVWTITQDSLIGTAINNAQTAQTTADGKAKVYYQITAPVLTASDVGDLWVDTDDNNKVTTWTGSAWVSTSNNDARLALANAATAQSTADGKIVTFFATLATLPISASEGDILFRTDLGNKMYTRRSGVWVDTQDTKIGDAITAAAGAQSTADGKVTTFYLPTSTPPTAEGVGDLWYDTTTNIITRWSGSAWQDIRDIGATKADAALDASSRYKLWLESNGITETKDKVATSYTGVILDNEGIGGYTAGVTTFRVDRLTGSAFYSGSITAAGLDVGTAGNVRGGQTAYNTGTGFFIGYSGAAHKISIGDGTKGITWDGSAFTVRGNLYAESGTFTGSISSTASLDIGSAGNIKGGQTAYNTGTGFWLGDDSGTKKFSIGNATNALTWNGSVLGIAGAITSTATITGGTLQTASSGARVILGGSSVQSVDATGNIIDINASNNQISFQNGANTGYFRFRINTGVANLETDAIFRSYSAIYCSGLDTGQIDASGTINANYRLKLPVGSNLY